MYSLGDKPPFPLDKIPPPQSKHAHVRARDGANAEDASSAPVPRSGTPPPGLSCCPSNTRMCIRTRCPGTACTPADCNSPCWSARQYYTCWGCSSAPRSTSAPPLSPSDSCTRRYWPWARWRRVSHQRGTCTRPRTRARRIRRAGCSASSCWDRLPAPSWRCSPG